MIEPNISNGDKFLIKLYNENFSDKIYVNSICLKKDRKKIISCLKKYYFDNFVISFENVPNYYFDSKKRICIKRGTSFSKNVETNKLIKWQEKSLEKWIDYLISDDNDYPMWVRYWIFKSVLSLGYYDYDKNVFNVRTDNTIFPFAKLDFDALDSSVKSVMFYYEDENISDEKLDDIIKQINFGKIYSRFLWNNESLVNSGLPKKDGVWVKYNQGSDYKKILSAINNKFTSWFFDDESIAKDYINVSDIFIYFTEDYSGKFTMPRVSIVTEQDKVAEVRGIADDNQNVEFQMLDALDSKLKELNHSVKYDLMLNDTEKVYDILSKENNGQHLTKEDLSFMYECDRNINFFGKDKDYELLKFLSRRDAKKDYAVIYNCSPDLVGFDSSDLEKDLYVFVGNVKNHSDKLSSCLKCPSVVLGDFDVSRLDNFEKLENLLFVKGNFIVNGMVDASCFCNLEEVGGKLVLGDLKVDFPKLKFANGKEYNKALKKVKKLVLDKV